MTTAPRTEAGRAHDARCGSRHAVTDILAIEAEATRLALEGVAERVGAMPTFGWRDTPDGDGATVNRAAVLALLSSASEDGT